MQLSGSCIVRSQNKRVAVARTYCGVAEVEAVPTNQRQQHRPRAVRGQESHRVDQADRAEVGDQGQLPPAAALLLLRHVPAPAEVTVLGPVQVKQTWSVAGNVMVQQA